MTHRDFCAANGDEWMLWSDSVRRTAYAIGSTPDVTLNRIAAAHQRCEVHIAVIAPIVFSTSTKLVAVSEYADKCQLRT